MHLFASKATQANGSAIPSSRPNRDSGVCAIAGWRRRRSLPSFARSEDYRGSWGHFPPADTRRCPASSAPHSSWPDSDGRPPTAHEIFGFGLWALAIGAGDLHADFRQTQRSEFIDLSRGDRMLKKSEEHVRSKQTLVRRVGLGAAGALTLSQGFQLRNHLFGQMPFARNGDTIATTEIRD
jgi:hypothetical protein